jgi:hypothetical protein
MSLFHEVLSKLRYLCFIENKAEAKGETESAKHFSKEMEVFTERVKNERIVKECKELLEKLPKEE